MVDRIIDYDRGVMINIIPTLNMDVYMYLDDPGVYLNAHGTQVPMELAKEAGYDTVTNEKKRMRKLKMAQAAKLIEDDFALDEQVSKEVVKELNGFKVVALPGGRHVIEDPDGNTLTPGAALTLELAEKYLEKLAGPAPAEEPQPETVLVPGGGGVGTERSANRRRIAP